MTAVLTDPPGRTGRSADPASSHDGPALPSGPSHRPGPAALSGVDPERVLLDSLALRRRQLCAAFCHGSTRSWRQRRRIWPSAAAGVLVVALIIAALAVAAAFRAQQEIQREQQIPAGTPSAPAVPGDPGVPSTPAPPSAAVPDPASPPDS